MFRLDNNFLIELGLGSLPPEEKNKMLAHIYETLEMRVGMKLAEQMSDAQLNEFESFIDRNDEAGALSWLETNFPNYKQVVADELEKLKNEIKQVAPQLLAAAQAAAQQGTQVPQSYQQPPMQPSVPQQTYQQPIQPSSMPPQQPQPQQYPQPAPTPPQQPPTGQPYDDNQSQSASQQQAPNPYVNGPQPPQQPPAI